MLALSVPLCAEDATSEPTDRTELGDVWLVKSTGTWSHAEAYGYYRVVLYRKGGEHAEDAVQVEILQATGDFRPLVRIKVIPLPVPEYEGFVRDIAFGKHTDTSIDIIFDIELKVPEGRLRRDTYKVDISGTYKLTAQKLLRR